MITFIIRILATLILLTPLAGAQTTVVLGKSEKVFVPNKAECKKNDTCDLLRVIFRTREYRLPPEFDKDVDIYGTDMYASYVTRSLASIEKYAFVQFIRGCEFMSNLKDDGSVGTYFNVNRPYMDVPDGYMKFCHPDWAIDSNGPDPIYSSNPLWSDNRHYFLEWTNLPKNWDPELAQGNLYGEELPKYPQVYITDRPQPAVLESDGWAKNASLEFRTCLYKTADIPKNVKSSNVNFATPIACFDWAHSFVYDHKAKSWNKPKGVTAACKRPFTPDEVAREAELRRWYLDHPDARPFALLKKAEADPAAQKDEKQKAPDQDQTKTPKKP